MSSRVLVLARTHSLWQLRVLDFFGLTFVCALLCGVVFWGSDVWDSAKLRRLTGLYSVLVFFACFIAMYVGFVQPRPRLSDLERSLPATQQDWLRAGLLARLRVPALMFGGVLLAHIIVGLASALPLSSLAVWIRAFGSALVGISLGFMLLGKQAKTTGLRLTVVMLPSLLVLAALIVWPSAALAIAGTSPVVVWAAWRFAPQKLDELVRPAAINSSAVSSTTAPASERTPAPSPKSASKRTSVVAPSVFVAMRRALAFRNWIWWGEVVWAIPAWAVGFYLLPWTVVVSGCVAAAMLVRPTPVDERVLRPWRHLPFPRRALFPIIGWKGIIAPAIGLLAVAIGASWLMSEHRTTRVARDSRDIRAAKDVAEIPCDVMIPGELWNVVFESTPIEVRPESGEPLLITPRMAFPGVYVWHPHQLPENCTVTTASEQIARALHRVHGLQVQPEDIAGDLVALPGGIGVETVEGVAGSFSRGEQYRAGVIDRIANAPLLFLPLLGLLSMVVLRKYRVRQLPAPKMTVARMLGCVALAHIVSGPLFLLWWAASEAEAIIVIRVALASVRSSLWVPSWLLFGLVGLGVWGLWCACARRFDRMEAPPVIPGVATQ